MSRCTLLQSTMRLTPRQLYYLLVVATFPTEHLLLGGPLIRLVGKDAIWATLAGGALAIIPLAVSLSVLARSPDGSLVTAARRGLGRLGPVALLLAGAAILLITVNIWGGFVQLLHTDLLPHTRSYVLLLFGLILVLYALPGGMETVGRVSELLCPYGIATVLAVWLLAATWYRLDYLMPVLPSLTSRFWVATYEAWSFLGEILFVSYLGAFATERSAVPRTAWLALATNTAMLALPTTAAILLFGEHGTASQTVPALSVVRTIHYGFLIERVDTWMVPLWVALVSLKIILWGLLGGCLLHDATGGRLGYAVGGGVALLSTAFASLVEPSLDAVEKGVEALWYTLAYPLLLLLLIAVATADRLRGRPSARA